MNEYIKGGRGALSANIGNIPLDVLEYEVSGGYIRQIRPQIQGNCAVWDKALRPAELKLVCECYIPQGNITAELEWILAAHAKLDITLDGIAFEDMIILEYKVSGGRKSPVCLCEVRLGASEGGGIIL